MNVEVVYALPEEQNVIELSLAEGATVFDAIKASGLLNRSFPDNSLNIIPDQTPVGIFGEQVSYQEQLRDGDRVEIYRPLELDPMQARHARASAQKSMKKAQSKK